MNLDGFYRFLFSTVQVQVQQSFLSSSVQVQQSFVSSPVQRFLSSTDEVIDDDSSGAVVNSPYWEDLP
jgi:hypothetical protein